MKKWASAAMALALLLTGSQGLYAGDSEVVYSGVPGKFRKGTPKEKMRQEKETDKANANYEREKAGPKAKRSSK
jgi:hypothetical protein